MSIFNAPVLTDSSKWGGGGGERERILVYYFTLIRLSVIVCLSKAQPEVKFFLLSFTLFKVQGSNLVCRYLCRFASAEGLVTVQGHLCFKNPS